MYFTTNNYQVRLAQALKSFENYKGECGKILEHFLQGVLCGVLSGIPSSSYSERLKVDHSKKEITVTVPNTFFSELESCQMMFFLQMTFIRVIFLERSFLLSEKSKIIFLI